MKFQIFLGKEKKAGITCLYGQEKNILVSVPVLIHITRELAKETSDH